MTLSLLSFFLLFLFFLSFSSWRIIREGSISCWIPCWQGYIWIELLKKRRKWIFSTFLWFQNLSSLSIVIFLGPENVFSREYYSSGEGVCDINIMLPECTWFKTEKRNFANCTLQILSNVFYEEKQGKKNTISSVVSLLLLLRETSLHFLLCRT